MKTIRSFIDKQGFFILLGVCVLIIVASGFWALSTRPPVPDGAESVSADTAQSLADAEARRLARPVSGRVAREYGQTVWLTTIACYGAHEAADLSAEKGENVRAARDGTVLSCRRDAQWGGVVELDHGGGLVTRYAGLAWPAGVVAGATVKEGDTIGSVGTLPFEAEDGPHLHFSVLRDGVPENPAAYSID